VKGSVVTNEILLSQMDGFMPITRMKMPILYLNKSVHSTGLIFAFLHACTGHEAIMMSIISKENIFDCIQEYRVGFSLFHYYFSLSVIVVL